MRAFSFKSCPFICSPKSSLHIYSPCSLKLEDARHVSLSPPLDSEAKSPDEKPAVAAKDDSDDVKIEVLSLKSSLKKCLDSGLVEVRKERVKWMDHMGKELAEIREFESVESGDSDDNADGYPACLCVIQ